MTANLLWGKSTLQKTIEEKIWYPGQERQAGLPLHSILCLFNSRNLNIVCYLVIKDHSTQLPIKINLLVSFWVGWRMIVVKQGCWSWWDSFWHNGVLWPCFVFIICIVSRAHYTLTQFVFKLSKSQTWDHAGYILNLLILQGQEHTNIRAEAFSGVFKHQPFSASSRCQGSWVTSGCFFLNFLCFTTAVLYFCTVPISEPDLCYFTISHMAKHWHSNVKNPK